MGGRRIQAYKRFIQYQQPGPPDKSRNQGQLLPHPVGVAANGGAKIVRQLKATGIFPNVGCTLFCRNTIQVGDKIQILNPP